MRFTIVFVLFILSFHSYAAGVRLVEGGKVNEIRLQNGNFQLTIDQFSFCDASCTSANGRCYINFDKNDPSMNLDDYKIFVAMSTTAYVASTLLGNAYGTLANNCRADYIIFKK